MSNFKGGFKPEYIKSDVSFINDIIVEESEYELDNKSNIFSKDSNSFIKFIPLKRVGVKLYCQTTTKSFL